MWQVYFSATRESVARDYHPDLIDRWAPLEHDAGEWAARLAQTNPFVAVEDGRIVGMAEIAPDGFIDYFYVLPERQGRGVGKALLAAIEGEAACRGITLLFADVSVTAKTFFLAHGFEITEARSKLILGHPADNFRMEKMLPVHPAGT